MYVLPKGGLVAQRKIVFGHVTLDSRYSTTGVTSCTYFPVPNSLWDCYSNDID